MRKLRNAEGQSGRIARIAVRRYAAPIWIACVLCVTPDATAQFLLPRGPVELSGELQIDQIDNTARSHLERAQAFFDGGQYQDAVETWLRLVEEQGDKLAVIADNRRPGYQRFVTLRRAIDLQLLHASRETPEVLAVYRQVVDPLAERWAASGELDRVVEELFLSSPSDEALDRLAQEALRAGNFALARFHWERLFATLRAADYGTTIDVLPDSPLWMALTDASVDVVSRTMHTGEQTSASSTWLYYPDSTLPLPMIHARLVLVSILEGDRMRAELELKLFRRLYPEAQGELGGKSVVYADALQQLLDESADWLDAQPASDWPTFSGNYQRNGQATALGDLHPRPLWRRPLAAQYARNTLDAATERELGFPALRPGEHERDALPFFPIVVDGRVYVSEGARIRAFELVDGTSASPVSDEGEIFPLAETVETEDVRPGQLGTPRFLPSSDGRLLVACLGSPVTVRASQIVTRPEPQQLVAIDLQTQRVALLLPPGGQGWAFEGGPIVHQGHIYVAMRRNDVQSEVHVACFEVATQRMKWRTMICAGTSFGSGETHEITHNLLTLHEDTLYINTNLGAVASLDRHQGRIRWLVEYPRSGTDRATTSHPAWHVARDLAPCIVDRGLLYVAPMDSVQAFCLDALSGHVLWETRLPEGVLDANHVVGAVGDQILLSGRRLWWLDRRDGRLSGHVAHNPYPPSGQTEPHGAGRAVIAGSTIYWPVAAENDEIHVLDAFDGRALRQPVRLPQELRAGNLCVADGILVVANENEIYALDGRPFAATSR